MTGGNVFNQGTIIGHKYLGVGMQGGTVTNDGTAALISGGETGVDSEYLPLVVINEGTIEGGKYGGIYLSSGGTVINSGTIIGTTYAISFNDLTGGYHSIPDGHDLLKVDPGAVFIGNVTATGSYNTMEFASSAAVGTISGIGTQFQGFETIAIDAGANWTLAGDIAGLSGDMISGFTGSDTIDVTDFAIAMPATLALGSNDILSEINAGQTLNLTFTSADTGAQFILAPDGNGGTDITTILLCYLRGTRILTPTGEMLVEDIAIGDLLVTRFNGFQKVKWIGRQTHDPHIVSNIEDIAPVRIRAGALGDNTPARDLLVSPGHSMLVGENLLLARLLVNGVSITQDVAHCHRPDLLEYYQVEFDTHDCIVAEGAWSESYADASDLRASYDNAAEFYALYPDYRPPEELALCAKRPMQGKSLEAALLPIVARAAAGLKPGELRGSIDKIVPPWRIDGWACDATHLDLPVLLEVLLDREVIGSLLACDYREDLFKADLGAGRCAFFWTAPVTLPPDAAARLHFRRASDGAALPGSAALPAAETNAPMLRLVS